MKVSIANNVNTKLIWLDVNYSNIDEIELKEQFFLSILSNLLIGSSIKIITIAPQHYSIAYDIGVCYPKNLNSKSFLINSILNCDLELVKKITVSEEFRRTLLFVIKKTSDVSDKELLEILDLAKNKPINLTDSIFFCENDGNSLCLYNVNIEIAELLSAAQKFTTDVVIETI
jgi:hypothetical protein